MNNLFEIIFSDDTGYSGGDLEITKWQDIPDKQIRRIFYLLPTGDYLVLGGYEKYYHFVECTQDIYGGNGKTNKEYTYLIGKNKDKCRVYKINLNTGNVEQKSVGIHEDFIKKLNQEFWR
jgi:hypothetical protein